MRALAACVAMMLFLPPLLTAQTAKRKTAKKAAPRASPSPLISKAALQQIQDEAAGSEGVLENAAALVPFLEQLLHPTQGQNVHILQYGDSHTASDDWANGMRQALQQRFGAGGAGFALAGHPFKGYRRFDAFGASSLGWLTEGTVGHAGDGRYGLGGVSITARRPGETVTFDAESATLQLYYLVQPGGGDFVISVDGSPTQTVSTDGEAAAAYLNYAATAGLHRYLVRTITGAPVRLFGWVADNHAGVTYETLGINGAQAPLILDWDDAVFASNMGLRKPALVVLAYGTNEALNPRFTVDGYQEQFRAVLAKIRRTAPLASILVVGPPDCLKAQRSGARLPLPHMEAVIAIQRASAAEMHCAFWDWRRRMGGPGSVNQWVKAGLSQPDHIHQTTAGYRLTAAMLFQELMQQFDRYQAARGE